MVKPLSDQFLAGAAVADDEHRAVKRRGTAGSLDRIEEGQALPDKLIRSLHGLNSKIRPTVGGKSHHLASIFDMRRVGNRVIYLLSVISCSLAWIVNKKVQVMGPSDDYLEC